MRWMVGWVGALTRNEREEEEEGEEGIRYAVCFVCVRVGGWRGRESIDRRREGEVERMLLCRHHHGNGHST